MLKLFYAPTERIKSEITKQFVSVIKNSKKLTEENKNLLLEELNLNNYWHGKSHDSFNGSKFIKDCNEFAVMNWMAQNQELADLWKSTVIEASKHSSEPNIIANKVVEDFKKNFEIRDED